MSQNDRERLIVKFSNAFARLQYKINFNVDNTSSFLLATDLLRDNSKRRLFKIVASNVENLFLELLTEKHSLQSLRGKPIFLSLIKKTIQDFLMGYYGFKVPIESILIKESFYTKLILVDEKILTSTCFFSTFS